MDPKNPFQINIIEFRTKINKDEYKMEKENEKKKDIKIEIIE